MNLPEDNPVLNFDEHTWVELEGYENLYWISPTGLIRNHKLIRKYQMINSGYWSINLTKDGYSRRFTVHRLVAKHFVDNPEGKPFVNHKDGNRLNNNANNLEWVTHTENLKHARDIGLTVYNYPTKGKKLSSKSKYFNVSWDKSRNLWLAAIRIEGKNYGQRRFKTEVEAAKHVNFLLDKYEITDRPRNVIE